MITDFRIYRRVCSRCKVPRNHRIFLVSRRMGIKLACLICNSKTQYMTLPQVQELEIPTSEIQTQTKSKEKAE